LTETLHGNDVIYFTVTAPVTRPLMNVVTWTVQTEDGLMATDIAAAQVNALSRLDVVAYYDVDRNGERHELEAPIPSVMITLESDGYNVMTATTNEQGIASFGGLVNGEYQLSIPPRMLGGPYTLNMVNMPQSFALDEVGLYQRSLAVLKGDDADCDGDGVPDYVEGVTDLNGDGVPDYCEAALLNLSSYLPIVRN
jgi:hypothetical protein